MSWLVPSFRKVLPSLVLVFVASACTPGAQEGGETPRATTSAPTETSQAGMASIDIADRTAQFLGGPADGSLSPDGRWVALTREESTTDAGLSLWILPAEGGDPLRLTDAGYEDRFPVWAPTGDRIYFSSTRPSRGSPGSFIMSLDVDPSTGRPRGGPRQVSLEMSTHPSPSPDGSLVAYRAGAAGSEVRVVPAGGGNSRLVTTTSPGQRRLEWEPDGSALYFVQGSPGRGGGLFRVPVEGGDATLVLQLEGGRGISAFHPGRRLVVARRDQGRAFIELVDFEGRVRWGRELPDVDPNSRRGVLGFAPDGRSLLGERQDFPRRMRVRPIGGGEPIDLPGAGVGGWPLAWTADSRSVIVESREGGRAAVRIVPTDGSPSRVVTFPEEGAMGGHATPTHATYRVPSADGTSFRLMALDLTSSETTLLSESLPVRRSFNERGPGGLYRDVDGFYFAEPAGERFFLKTVRPGEPARLVSPRPMDDLGYTFQGDREAFVDVVDDSLSVMFAEPRGSTPRVLLRLGGAELRERITGGVVLGFSYDGSLLAVGAPDGPSWGTVLVVRVPRNGRATDVRQVSLGTEFWYEPRWLPDDSGFTLITGIGSAAWITFVPVAPDRPVRHLTRDEGMHTWQHEVSPDGRWVAYGAEEYRGTTLWRLDIEEALEATRP